MSSFPDHFSRASAGYAAHRPGYPPELFSWLSSVAPSAERAWDCGTGNGQAARSLAAHFRHVVASDPSTAQLAQAAQGERVSYAAMTAERVAIASKSVSLVTVAQALHWFRRPEFYAEVHRVLVAGGVLAVWTYGLPSFGEQILDDLLREFYEVTVGPYWPAERAIVEAGYAKLDFPFDELSPPEVAMESRWTQAQFGGYLNSWSALPRAREALGSDPLGPFLRAVARHWGTDAVRTIRWPLEVRAGRTTRGSWSYVT